MGTISQTLATQADSVALVQGHADASHWGSLDSDCDRCVTLAAACGIDLARS